MTDHERFEFPPLGPTGEGDPPFPGTYGQMYWQPEQYTGFYVTHQGDRPACAFRCHYRLGRSKGSAPTNQETADRFIAWVKEKGYDRLPGD